MFISCPYGMENTNSSRYTVLQPIPDPLMADPPEINAVEPEADYIHVQFRDPDRFEEIRTPDWAANAAQSVSDGAKVRTGNLEDSDDWLVETVLLTKSVGEDTAKEQAWKIVEKIES